MKRRFITIFGVTNKHSRDTYSFFADYDNVPLPSAVIKAKRVLKASGAPYACLIKSNKDRYHLYVPGFFTGEEVMRLFWFAKCDPWYAAFFLKHGRNVLRWTKKRKSEHVQRVVWEAYAKESRRSIPTQLCQLLEELFNCKPPTPNRERKGSMEFSEYHMRPNGSKFYNKFLTPEGLNERMKEVLGVG